MDERLSHLSLAPLYFLFIFPLGDSIANGVTNRVHTRFNTMPGLSSPLVTRRKEAG